MPKKYRCPCCGNFTLDNEPGNFDICPVCYWEDDNIQADDPYYEGGANEVSLNQARENYRKFGACEECCLDAVRPPTEDEKSTLEPEEISDEMKQFLIQQHTLRLIRHYTTIQELLLQTNISRKTIENLHTSAKKIIEELKRYGIVFDYTTSSFINIATGLPITDNSEPYKDI
jgi:hypothetical protein